MKCRQELCTHWSGDGDVCPCAVFDMEPNTPEWASWSDQDHTAERAAHADNWDLGEAGR